MRDAGLACPTVPAPSPFPPAGAGFRATILDTVIHRSGRGHRGPRDRAKDLSPRNRRFGAACVFACCVGCLRMAQADEVPLLGYSRAPFVTGAPRPGVGAPRRAADRPKALVPASTRESRRPLENLGAFHRSRNGLHGDRSPGLTRLGLPVTPPAPTLDGGGVFEWALRPLRATRCRMVCRSTLGRASAFFTPGATFARGWRVTRLAD